MAITNKTSLGLDLIDVSTEKLEDSRVKISANFQLIHNLFVSNTAYLLGAPIASASTTTIGSVGSGDTKHVTGTTTITSFGVSTTGVKKTLIFDGVLTLVHNATSLICLGNTNIVTAVGDIAEFQCIDGETAKWMCTGYTRNSGQPLLTEDKLGTPIASATTTTIGTAGLGNYIHITGTTTITSFGTATTAGIRRTLIFDGALTLTHNATSLICMGGGNITTVAGMIIEVEAETTANWRVVSITHPNVSPAELGYLDGVTSSIQAQMNSKASLVSPTFTGIPLSTTPTAGDNSPKIATTEFVAMNSVSATFIRDYTLTNSAAGFPVQDADFNNFNTVFVVFDSPIVPASGFSSFKWTSNTPLGKFYDYDNTLTGGETYVSLYHIGAMRITKRTQEPYYDIIVRYAGVSHHWYYAAGIVFDSFVASSFNSLNGAIVKVYGTNESFSMT